MASRWGTEGVSPRPVYVAAAAVLPWTWFAGRDLGGGLDGPAVIQVPLDLVALVLPLLAVAVALALVAAGWRHPLLLVASASWVVFAIVATTEPWRTLDSPVPEHALRVVHANLLVTNDSERVVEALPVDDADVVVTSETSTRLYHRLVDRLGPPAVSGGSSGPCTLEGDRECGALNVWTRYPAVLAGDQRAAEAARGVRVEIAAPAGPVVLYAVHPEPPSVNPRAGGRTTPWRHRRVLAELLDAASAEHEPVILVGDLNLSDRQSGYRDMSHRLRDAVRSSPTGPTSLKWYLRPLFLRIDHVFVSRTWCGGQASRFDIPGSDHRGVRAVVGPCSTDVG
jgi:endonuclease/exonuclease/phosphatase (EEP) superfamily protein YafD